MGLTPRRQSKTSLPIFLSMSFKFFFFFFDMSTQEGGGDSN
jgi:hypothetical protein